MQEYLGQTAKNYKQTKGKQLLLIPGLMRHVPQTTSGTLLDIACGPGDLYPLTKNKGYKYYGLDLSPEMIERAQKTYPEANFSVLPTPGFSSTLKGPFDVILISMLFPAIDSLEKIKAMLEEARSVLSNSGRVIIGVTHPCFDHYMQSFLFKRTDVETNFDGYFTSGVRMKIPQTISGVPFTFEDYHWTFSNYINTLRNAGLTLVEVDECHPVEEARNYPEYFKDRTNVPTYLVLVAESAK